MSKTLKIVLTVGLLVSTASYSLAQNKFQQGKGAFISSFTDLGVGYKFNNNLSALGFYTYDRYDRNQFKIGAKLSYTSFMDRKKSWGYGLDLELSSLTGSTARNSILTPGISPSLFKKIELSDNLDLVPTVSTFISFPELNNTAYGASISLPLSIRVFGDKRLIIGPGIEFGRSNVRFKTEGLLGLILGFNF